MAQLGNCPKCRKLYLKIRDICDECYQKQENDFIIVASYLRENLGDTIQEVSDATQVSVAQIRQFILAGRLIVGNFPNLSYPCEICGELIRSGKVCKSCMDTINKQINITEKAEGEASLSQNTTSGRYIKNYL